MYFPCSPNLSHSMNLIPKKTYCDIQNRVPTNKTCFSILFQSEPILSMDSVALVLLSLDRLFFHDDDLNRLDYA